ncbi:sialidase family protein [Chitinophaga caseinilytica]|uniref:Sialidase family protein n=1 Tax=Chitinophaga caseinilytica TaxID=2267521 RepID=A0ABZ2Z2Y5_9BACT
MQRYFIFLFITAMAAGCGQQQGFRAGGEHILSDTNKLASCTHISHDAAGRLIVSWVEQEPGSDEGSLWYAVSEDGGEHFGQAVPVTTATGISPQPENMPKIVFRKNREAIAMFGTRNPDPRNKYAGKVWYVRSSDGGKNWQPAVPLVTDTAGYDQRYFDMSPLPDGNVACVWLDNRKDHPLEGSTLFIATSGQQGFERPRPLVQTVCQCCRTSLYTDPQGGLHVAFRDIIHDTIRDMVHMYSKDGGATFTQPVRISADNWAVNGCPHTGPTMTSNRSGLHFAWFTMGGGQGVFYGKSINNGISFSSRESISAKPTAKHPQLVSASNGDLLLAWDEPSDTTTNRIGFVHKSPEGKTLSTGYLTGEGEQSVFPVMKPVAEKTVAVAYRKRVRGKEMICVRRVDWD